ncbi:hypothetical protein SDC9_66613 [bioreactor metagenome]|uniref:Uncharacterized protein n=1 Tax=bioreactor metagenome TaxID=1076179 RepID=A0A644Y1T0_9ZZZZ
MRFAFLDTPDASAPEHLIDFASADELRRWLVQNPRKYGWAVAVYAMRARPTLITHPSGCPIRIVGGFEMPADSADRIWNIASDVIRREVMLDKFLEGLSGFTRRAIYPEPKLVSESPHGQGTSTQNIGPAEESI